MAQKKKVPAKKAAARKTARAVAKSSAKSSARSSARSSAIKPAKKGATKKPATTKPTHHVSGASKPAGGPFVSLGRPKITADEPLYLLFKEDYHARQIFDFLRVETVRDLEQFAASEIVDRLTRPVHESIERIRSRLAEKNRYLCGDEKYLITYRKQVQADAEKE